MKISRRPIPWIQILVLTLVLGGAWTSPAWAVQGHGGIEGLVSHEIGHLLFVIGMGYLLFRLYRIPPTGPGWFEFKWFLWLILLWNCLTFTGHWLHEIVDPAHFITSAGRTVAFLISSPADLVLYLSQLDHLLLVPSFLFLLLALKKWRRFS
ncbi:MAG: hypothetical protein L3J03_11110 [Desulfobacterales bacterium]|nr:hypothetical protein [Desulfobacterales bacterium]